MDFAPRKRPTSGSVSKTREEGFGEEGKRRIMLGTYVRRADIRRILLKAQKVAFLGARLSESVRDLRRHTDTDVADRRVQDR